MQDTLGFSATLFKAVRKLVIEFKHSRKNLKVDPRSERPKSVTTPEIVKKKIHNEVMKIVGWIFPKLLKI